MKKNDHDQTKKLIFTASLKEFAEKGFAGARMGSIARRAKVNQALIHYYYNNKEKLYKTVLTKMFGINETAVFMDRMKQINQAYNFTPSQKLYVLIYTLINVHLELHNPVFSRIIMRGMSEDRENIKDIMLKYREQLYENFESVITEGVQKGEFETKNPFLVILGIHTFIIHFINTKDMVEGSNWCNAQGFEKEKDNLLDFLIDHTFKSLRPDDKLLKIPVIPEEALSSINKMIHEYNSEKKSELFYEDFK